MSVVNIIWSVLKHNGNKNENSKTIFLFHYLYICMSAYIMITELTSVLLKYPNTRLTNSVGN